LTASLNEPKITRKIEERNVGNEKKWQEEELNSGPPRNEECKWEEIIVGQTCGKMRLLIFMKVRFAIYFAITHLIK
jgi:hypothetical protein